MAFDGTYFGEHFSRMARRLETSTQSQTHHRALAPLSEKCGGCGLPIVAGKLVCEVCKDFSSLGIEQRNRKWSEETSIVKDWARGTRTNHGSEL